MRYLKSLLVFVLLLVGCSPKSNEPIKVLVPTGAPALALVEQASKESENQIDFVTGSEALSAELVKEDSEYDIIFAPVNLGAKMIQAGKSTYKLKAVITWGNLYVVGTSQEALNESKTFTTFGEGSVVDFVLKNAIDLSKYENVEYYSSAQDVQGQLLSGKTNLAMLAEPAVTATINKAKQQNINLEVLVNLQEEYQKNMNTATAGFPQAAIFVKEGSESKVKDFLKEIETWVNETAVNTPDKIEELVDSVGVDTLGVPSAAISKATWAKQNIKYVDASTCKEDLTTLLSLMNITFSEDMLSK
ncbi:MAG: hypothetical protein ACI4U3_05190 [Traorella sp.]